MAKRKPEPPPPSIPVCDTCGTSRKPEDPDYRVLDVIFGSTLGWYADAYGTQICGPCMERMIRNQ